MGHWIETCILSKLPIEENEYCVMLIGKDALNNIFDADKLKFIFTSYPYSNLHIYKGCYNGRGTLEDMKEYDNSIFVNYNVWTWLTLIYSDLELARTKQSYYEDTQIVVNRIKLNKENNNINVDFIWEYMKVSYSATLLRLVPNSSRLKGYTETRLSMFRMWLNLLSNLNNDKIVAEKQLLQD